MNYRKFYITSLPKSREADIHLGYGDGEVFIDLNFDEKGQLHLTRISFDGYGCCDVNGNSQVLSLELSTDISQQIKQNKLDQEIIRSSIFYLIKVNKKYIWEDAIEAYELGNRNFLQIATYSSTKIYNYIYFALVADHFDVDEVTKKLDVEPTRVKIKDYPTPKKTSWKYRVDVSDDNDFTESINHLISLFTEKIIIIKSLKERYNLTSKLQFVISIDVDPEISTPYFPLNSPVIQFLYETGTTVEFDLYKVDTIGILNK